MYVAIYQEDPNDYGDTNITFMEDPYCNFWGKRSAKIAAWDDMSYQIYLLSTTTSIYQVHLGSTRRIYGCYSFAESSSRFDTTDL